MRRSRRDLIEMFIVVFLYDLSPFGTSSKMRIRRLRARSYLGHGERWAIGNLGRAVSLTDHRPGDTRSPVAGGAGGGR